jgi:hypothetical protein
VALAQERALALRIRIAPEDPQERMLAGSPLSHQLLLDWRISHMTSVTGIQSCFGGEIHRGVCWAMVDKLEMGNRPMVRTSEAGWLAHVAKAYRNREQIVIIDDANAGIDPSGQTLLQMGLKRGLSRNDWIGVCVSLGMTVWGAVMVILAILDPDPTSKLGLMVGSGVVLTFGGGFTAIWILTNRKPPKVRVSPRGGFEIAWD